MKCHICSQETLSFADPKTTILYYQCRECEYIFKSPKYYQDLAVQQKRYDLHQNNENDEGYREYYRRFLNFILPFVGHAKNGLDFGCGATSLLSEMITKSNIVCDYYDPIYHSDLIDKNKKYDLIVSTEVFEHLHHPKLVFGSLLNRLSDDGILAVQTQFHTNNREDFLRWYYHHDATHIVFFTAKTFMVLSEQFNCKLVGNNGKNIVVIRKNSTKIPKIFESGKI